MIYINLKKPEGIAARLCAGISLLFLILPCFCVHKNIARLLYYVGYASYMGQQQLFTRNYGKIYYKSLMHSWPALIQIGADNYLRFGYIKIPFQVI